MKNDSRSLKPKSRSKGAGRKPLLKEEDSNEPKLLRSDLTRKSVEMDVLGVRISRNDGNRFKRFCAEYRFNYGEAVAWLMEQAGVKPDGTVSDD